jgi:cobalt transporter subunit CbtA
MAALFDLAVLKRIVAAAAAAGMLAGLLLTAVQQLQVVPALLEAEVYEQAAAAGALPSGQAAGAVGHHHEAQHAAAGLERTLLSAVSNVSLALGFALLLGASMYLGRSTPGWRSGLLWGLAGYVVFFAAPSLGLPPEVPGTEAARLSDRQLWWLMTVLSTAVGLSLLAFARPWAMRIAGVVLLALPHLVGAPQPQIHSSTAPAELVAAFIVAAVLTNFVFWLALGGLLGFFHDRFRPERKSSAA